MTKHILYSIRYLNLLKNGCVLLIFLLYYKYILENNVCILYVNYYDTHDN